MARTSIEWTEETWNPIRGCSKVSNGCRNCYAMRQAHRFSGPGKPYEGLTKYVPHKGPQWTGEIRCVEELLEAPLRWRKPRKVFVNSMSDLFHPDVPFEFVDRVFAVMGNANHHTYQVLTKRPDRMAEYVRSRDGLPWPLPNVWLGTSVEDQDTADERIPHLLQTPAAVRWLSMEPLLGEVDLTDHFYPDPADCLSAAECRSETWPGQGAFRDDASSATGGKPWGECYCTHERIQWVVVGGESGPGARPMHPEWVRSIRDQCQAAGVPFFFKQWGAWKEAEVVAGGDLGGDMRRGKTRIVQMDREPDGHFRKGDVFMSRVGKKKAGRELDGRTWDEYPEVSP